MTDYSSLSKAERMVSVYAAYGRAMLSANRLERRLGALLVAQLVDSKLPAQSWSEAVSKIDRLTLGPLIQRFAQVFSPSEDLMEELDNMLYFRNEIAHRISEQVLRAVRAEKWEEKLTRELNDIGTYFEESTRTLQPFVDDWLNRQGVTEDEFFAKLLTFFPVASAQLKR